MTLETTQTVPLAQSQDGSILVQGTRVTLDSVVHHFKLGSTPEEIAQKFPSLRLADIYATIAYYLAHRESIEDYLRQRAENAQELRSLIEADQDRHGIRERLLSRLSPPQK